MTSQRRLGANPRNAQLSTGPRTPQGQAAVRYNGLPGLTARHAALFVSPPAVAEMNIDLKNQSQPPDPFPLRTRHEKGVPTDEHTELVAQFFRLPARLVATLEFSTF